MKARLPYLLLAIAVPALVLLTEFRWIPLAPPRCPFETYLGVHCPMCGTSRAWVAFLHGDWRAALAYNPLFAFFGLACAVAYLDVAGKAVNPASSIGAWAFAPLLRRPGNIAVGAAFLTLLVYNNFFNKTLG